MTKFEFRLINISIRISKFINASVASNSNKIEYIYWTKIILLYKITKNTNWLFSYKINLNKDNNIYNKSFIFLLIY